MKKNANKNISMGKAVAKRTEIQTDTDISALLGSKQLGGEENRSLDQGRWWGERTGVTVTDHHTLLTQILSASGHYMYRQFNIQKFHVLPTQCIYVFCVDLRTNSVYFPTQH